MAPTSIAMGLGYADLFILVIHRGSHDAIECQHFSWNTQWHSYWQFNHFGWYKAKLLSMPPTCFWYCISTFKLEKSICYLLLNIIRNQFLSSQPLSLPFSSYSAVLCRTWVAMWFPSRSVSQWRPATRAPTQVWRSHTGAQGWGWWC